MYFSLLTIQERMNFKLLFLFFFHFLVCQGIKASQQLNGNGNENGKGKGKGNGNGVYIVYMGGSPPPGQRRPADLLMTILLKRDRNAIVQRYKNGFSGFAARLSPAEAEEMARHPGVVSVFRDPVLKLHTTHSWEFLQYQSSVEIQSPPSSSSSSASLGSDTIIGILDTGIWPESQSFDDEGMGPIPSRWKGVCMQGQNFTASNCNRKIIGARYYKDPDTEGSDTPRDSIGHGTHVASTAAGSAVANASYYTLASGTAKGGSPSSHVAMYRVCSSGGCRGSAILAAFDDAIADGVDVLSLSLGSSAFYAPEFDKDPIAIGAFHAVQKGIAVVCSAGNDGPDPMTVVNVAPWILTVAATTIDREFESDVVLGDGRVFKGDGINFSNLQKSAVYPLITGISAKFNNDSGSDARLCYPDTLDGDKIRGKIVVCEGQYSVLSKMEEVKGKGGVGIVLVDDVVHTVATKVGSFPFTAVTTKDGVEIAGYINSTSSPVATILPTKTVTNYKPAPIMAYFSARGPAYSTQNILKPDIAGPGVNILAAWFGNDTDSTTTPTGMDPPQFNLLSGTSMSCPHVSGVVAAIRSQNPTWSPAAIRSAIMTTAIQMNNMKVPLTTHTGEAATPYEFGAGEVNPPGALDPGLVYDLDPTDYIQFLCFYGYNTTRIKLLEPSLSDGFACPKDSGLDMISSINYPSIAVNKNVATTPVNVTRILTNVGESKDTSYNVTIVAPKGLAVRVEPETLTFSAANEKLSYQVSFSAAAAEASKEAFGMISWSNGKYKVSSPFVVSAPS